MSLVRIFTLPLSFDPMHLPGTKFATFTLVDEFNDEAPGFERLAQRGIISLTDDSIVNRIKDSKRGYYDPARSYLVLRGDGRSFTLNYKAE